MKKSDMWKKFEETGDITYYNLYKVLDDID